MVTHLQKEFMPLQALPSRRELLIASAGLGLLPAWAQPSAWPSKTIRIVAAQAPGSSNDATARAYADFFSQKLKAQVVVDNRPGGVGMSVCGPANAMMATEVGVCDSVSLA